MFQWAMLQIQLTILKGNVNNGTLLTGDMAKRDVDGYYYIVGRKGVHQVVW